MDRMSRPLGVNLSGFLESEKGLGEAARAVARALRAAGVPVVLNNVRDEGSANRPHIAAEALAAAGVGGFAADNPHPVNVIVLNAPELRLLRWEYGEGYLRSALNVAYWNWEMVELPAAWLDSLRLVDEVWVPSQFTREAVAAVSPVPVRWVPYAVTLPLSPSRPDRARFGLPEGPAAFVFLSAFDHHSTPARKNPAAVVAAFRRAFGDRPDVRLLVKTVHADSRPASAELLRRAAEGAANVTLLDGVLDRAGMWALMASCDAVVAMHRSEGFGFPLYEAAALGKPVIATGWSGNTDFLSATNSLPVRYGFVESSAVGGDGIYPPGSKWAEPDVAHAAELMARLVADREAAAELGRRAAEDVARELSVQRVGRLLRRRLESLTTRVAVPSAAGLPTPPGPPTTAGPGPTAAGGAKTPSASPLAPADLTAVPVRSHRRLLGPAIVAAKRAAAGLLQQALRRQSDFNADLVRESAELRREVAALREETARVREFSRRLDELESAARAAAVELKRVEDGLRRERRTVELLELWRWRTAERRPDDGAGPDIATPAGADWLAGRAGGSLDAVGSRRALGRLGPLGLSALAREVAAKLKPGGTLTLSAPAPGLLSLMARAARLAFGDVWPADPETVAFLLTEAGFGEPLWTSPDGRTLPAAALEGEPEPTALEVVLTSQRVR
jgi:glycosyltransferase involved in cell wall biosynthesis